MATQHIIGLDVGSRCVKAIQLTGTDERYKITEFGIRQITPDVTPEAAVEDLLRSRRFKTKRTVSAVSGRHVFVRYITMPVMSDEELVNAAKYELGKYIPVEVDEVLHDSQKLEDLPPQEGQDPEMRVLLVAAKRTHIDDHIGVVEGSGLQPAVIDVDSFALGNAYEMAGQANPQSVSPGKLVALVDIGASKTNINIMSDSMSFFTREFYKGGNDITDAISKRLSMEPGEAENLKITFDPASVASSGGTTPGDTGGPGTDTGGGGRDQTAIVLLEKGDTGKIEGGGSTEGSGMSQVEDCISGILEEICHDINISIDYFENQYDRQVEEVYVTGGASSTVGLLSVLETTVQRPVTRWDPAQYFELDLPNASLEELQNYGAQATIALGLATRISD